MVNETARATVIKLTPIAKFSGPNANQGSVKVTDTQASSKSPESGGQVLPLQGKRQPRAAQDFSQIREAVSEINEFVQSVQRDLSFNVDEASGYTVIKVIDSESGELIRQIPSEEVLAIASHIRDARELMLDQKDIPAGLLFSEST